jgi:streptogramin lyase
MRNYFYLIFILVLLVSCKEEEKKTDSFSLKEITNKQKYQMELYQVEANEYTLVVLNRFSGKVFVGKNASGWYEATNADSIPVYKTPTYSIKVFKGPESNPQISLIDEKEGELYMYIVGHTANFYNTNASIKALERG